MKFLNALGQISPKRSASGGWISQIRSGSGCLYQLAPTLRREALLLAARTEASGDLPINRVIICC